MRFELIKGTGTLQGTCYFEFVKHSDKKKPCWNENAFYLEDGVFIYFANVFSKSSDRFDYYSFCKFNQSEQKRLSRSLDAFIKTLNLIQSLEEYKSFFENEYQHILFDNESEKLWRAKAKKLTAIAQKLKEFTDECLREKEVLWILGL